MGDVGTQVFQIRIKATSASMQLDVKSAAGGENPEAVIQFTGGTL